MAYKSLDTIPCKVFYEIARTGDFSLLNTDDDENLSEEELRDIWSELEKENQKYETKGKSKKNFTLYKQFEKLSAKYEIVNNIVSYLLKKDDEELEEMLESYGYKVNQENREESLKKIFKKTNSIVVKLKRIKQRLPKKPKESQTSIDESIYGYASVAEIAISDTNKVTMTQYHAIKSLGEQRIKSMKKNGRG